jgi:hypothetical protein
MKKAFNLNHDHDKLARRCNIFLTIFVIVFFVGSLYLAFEAGKYHQEKQYLQEDSNILILDPIDENITNKPIKKILAIGDLFAQTHTYINKTYTCVNFSNEVKELFDHFNITSKRVNGCRFDNASRCHRWLKVELDFEPIHGNFVDYSQKYKIREVMD